MAPNGRSQAFGTFPAPAAAPPSANGNGRSNGFGNFPAPGQPAAAPPANDRRDRGDNRQQATPQADQRNGNYDHRLDNRSNNFDNRYDNRPDNRFNDRARETRNNNFRSYQHNYTARERFRAPSYRRPSGWYDHRWTFGEILPSLFWAPNFWLNDYYTYDLTPPPPGTVWVRDGYDALLIDRYDGQIIQVAYDVFY